MSRARNLADLLDANGDVASGALDNVPPSNDASALTTGTLPVDRVPYVGRRNLIINGAMQVAQRGTSATHTNGQNAYKTIDRWKVEVAGNSNITLTNTQESDAPTGFKYSNKLAVTTAGGTPSGTSYVGWMYAIEGYDVEALGYGNSDAKSITLSLWAKSNKTTNSFSVGFRNQISGNNINWYQTIDLSAANTWEYITVTIDPYTAAALLNAGTSSAGVQLHIKTETSLGTSAESTWETGNFLGSPDMEGTAWGTSTSNYLQITGVQLEVGSVATPFEHRSYGEELALCERYYRERTGGVSKPTTGGFSCMTTEFSHNTEGMRVVPSYVKVQNGGGSAVVKQYGHYFNISNYGMSNAGHDYFLIQFDAEL